MLHPPVTPTMLFITTKKVCLFFFVLCTNNIVKFLWCTTYQIFCWLLLVGKPQKKQVIHWRTDTLKNMFELCRLDVQKKFNTKFERSYFLKAIPSFVKRKKNQTGLCPKHYTAMNMHSYFVKKRRKWHVGCKCKCQFCTVTVCHWCTSQIFLVIKDIGLQSW